DVYLASRPREAERQAIELLIRLCRETGARLHVVHLSDAGSLPLLREARAAGLPVTVETCPHYLHFAAEEIRDGATDHKCAPPIREAENRERLWDALGAGDIDLIATDHSPCPPEMKGLEDGDFLRAWGGIASLQLTLSVVWRGARERGYTPVDVARWMCEAPARLAGLEARKGAIAPGRDADFVVWDPDAEFMVDPARLHHRHPLTPYAGATLPGVVAATYLRGRLVYDRGHFAAEPTGRVLTRSA
ncbi:MAG TPA: amidohydrolase family protein, partial [Longimicrobium sp.]|nr:amidohydrolase family protein [Longimicrobium sp.]